MAKIRRAKDVKEVVHHGLDGVGLFRTEFLFLRRSQAPTEDDQFRAYRAAITALPNFPVVVRTLDLGGDKIARFLEQHYDSNPHLGLRGLRFSLSEPELFTTQLRAIVRASRIGDVRVLFPMVAGVDEVRRAVDLPDGVVSDLGSDVRPALGAMIETPASVFAIDEILEAVDFVSIGTNDLTQFILAADRDAVDLLDDYSVLHPAVLRAIARITESASHHGRPVCVCGEAAGDPTTACLLLGLGVHELSSSPARSARVRYAIREQTLRELNEMATTAVSLSSNWEVRKLLQQVSLLQDS